MLLIDTSRKLLKLATMLGLIVSGSSVFAQVVDPDPNRFSEDIQAFVQWDAKNATPKDPVVFVGSSSIRFWNTGERFPDVPVVNRGFGGSHISDVIYYIHETVLRYQPKMIIFYAGDNDISDGKSKQQVMEDYARFVNLIHASNPDTIIVYIPIKPSLARWSLWPQMRAANALIRRYTEHSDRLHYVDLASTILGKDGLPRPELFIADGLHLNSSGYDVWSKALALFLAALP